MEAFIRTNLTLSFFISQIVTIRTPHAMHIEANSARCWNDSPEDPRAHSSRGSIFHPNRSAVVTGLNFVIVLCTQSVSKLPILMENNKNHRITLPKGLIGFSSLDVSDNDEPKYQTRDPYELINAMLSTKEQNNNCFLLHSTIPSQSLDKTLQLVYGNENSIPEQPNLIGHCISSDAQMSKGFAELLSERIPRLRRVCRLDNLLKDQVFPFWDSSSRRYIYNLVTKGKYSDKPDLPTLATTLQNMQAHATMHGVSTIAIPKTGCELDQMNWQVVVKLPRNIFVYSDVQILVYSLDDHAVHAITAEGVPEFYAEDEIDRYSEEFYLNERELETNFTSDIKSCQPACDEQFPTSRPRDQKESLIEHNLQYQLEELIEYIKQFDFQYSDITDNEMNLFIDMLIDSKDVYSLHKFYVGKTRHKIHVTLKPNAELKRQRASKVPLHLEDKLEKLLTQFKDADFSRKMGSDDEMGSLFVNPKFLMPKNDYIKLVNDARYLNSGTELTNYSWPLEPVQMIITRVNGKFFSVSDLF